MKSSLHILKEQFWDSSVGSGTGDEWDNELAGPAIHRLNSYKGMYRVIFQLKIFVHIIVAEQNFYYLKL